jgi:putative membrane protein
MFLDLILAILHHLLMFALLSLLVIEMTIIRPGVRAAGIQRASRLLKGPDFYLSNPFFWAKIAAFLAVALLSLPPTLRLLAWRARLRANQDFTPSAAEVRKVRMFMHMEATVFVLIPVFAALMARGYGS